MKPLCKFITLYSVTSLNTAVFLVFTSETSNLVCNSLCTFCLCIVSCSDRLHLTEWGIVHQKLILISVQCLCMCETVHLFALYSPRSRADIHLYCKSLDECSTTLEGCGQPGHTRIYTFVFSCRSQNISLCMLTRLKTRQPVGLRFFCSSPCPVQLWGLHYFPASVLNISLSVGIVWLKHEADTLIHLLSVLSMCGAVPTLSTCL